MRKFILRTLFCFLLALAGTPLKPTSAFPAGTSVTPPATEVFACLTPDLLLEDWNKRPTLFNDQLTPIRIFVYFTARGPAIGLKDLDWKSILTSFKPKVLQKSEDNGRETWATFPDKILLRTVDGPSINVIEEFDGWAGVIDLTPEHGWPTGEFQVSGDFNYQAEHLKFYELHQKPIRFSVRPSHGIEDQRLSFRFSVYKSRHNPGIVPGEVPDPLKAANRLLAAFPNDIYGLMTRGDLYNRSADEGSGFDRNNESFAKALRDFQKIEQLTLPPTTEEIMVPQPNLSAARASQGVFDWSAYNAPIGYTDKLRFWAVLRFKIANTKSCLQIQKSPYLLGVNSIKNPKALIRHLRDRQDPLSRRLIYSIRSPLLVQIEGFTDDSDISTENRNSLRQTMNRAIATGAFANADGLHGIRLPPDLLAQRSVWRGGDLNVSPRLNRYILSATYPDAIVAAE